MERAGYIAQIRSAVVPQAGTVDDWACLRAAVVERVFECIPKLDRNPSVQCLFPAPNIGLREKERGPFPVDTFFLILLHSGKQPPRPGDSDCAFRVRFHIALNL